MKKLFCTLLCCTSILSLASCSPKEENKETYVTLTADNCAKYINFNMYITDYSNTLVSNGLSEDSTGISCVVHIETSKKIDCRFDNVSITYSPTYSGTWDYNYGSTPLPNATLDYEGHSHISYIAFNHNSSLSNNAMLPNLTFRTGIIKSIEGYAVLSNNV